MFGACGPLACGGRVITDKDEPPEAPASDGGDRTTPPQPEKQNPGSGSGSSTGDDLDGLITLPECKLGFTLSDAGDRPCNYLTESLCYESKEKACACACKKQSGTSCISGFPQYNGRVEVTCK